MSNIPAINVVARPTWPVWTAASATFVTPVVPLRPAALQVRNKPNTVPVFSGSADENGIIAGLGSVDIETGIVQIAVSGPQDQPLNPANIWINGIGYIDQLTDPQLLGIDGTRLPITGRVQTIMPQDIVLIHSTKTDSLATPQAGATISLSRTALAWAKVKDANGILVPTAAYSVVLSTGALTWSNPLDLGDTTPPYVCQHRIQDLATVISVSPSGIVKLNLPLTHNYLTTDSFVSSVLVTGTLQARTQDVGSYQSWSGSFDNLGDSEQTLYDNVLYPITVRNDGSVEDDWVLKFNTSNQFIAIGKQRGQLPDVGTVAVDFSPINPLTNLPFFTVDASGWRSGIIPGNFVYFRVRAASCPIWIIRATMPNADPPAADSITIELIGDVMP